MSKDKKKMKVESKVVQINHPIKEDKITIFDFCKEKKLKKSTRIGFQAHLGVLKDTKYPYPEIENLWRDYAKKLDGVKYGVKN